MAKQGKLIILSGPSGTGKGTIASEYMKRRADRTVLSVSATTRAPRGGDAEGVTYYFYSRERFEAEAAAGGMLEYAEYCGNLYGTPKKPVEEALRSGKDVLLEIDVQGGFKVKAQSPEALTVFVMPPSAKELERRLSGRGTESSESIRKRLAAAVGEIECAGRYEYILVNDVLGEAVGELEKAVDGGLRNVSDMMSFVEGVLEDVKTLSK